MGTLLTRWGISHYVNVGESGFVFYFKGNDLLEQNTAVQRFANSAASAKPVWLLEIVPSFDSVTLCFDLSVADEYLLMDWLLSLAPINHTQVDPSHYDIEVNYDRDGQYDLATIAHSLSLSIDAVIDYHLSQPYRTYAIGFSPGFAYLGQLPEKIRLPRRSQPRIKVPAGAVAIADGYTAVYPQQSPGGWHIIGMLAGDCVDMDSLGLKIGDLVTFTDIDRG